MISTCSSLRTSSNENDIKVATLRKVRTWNGTFAASWVVLYILLFLFEFCWVRFEIWEHRNWFWEFPGTSRPGTWALLLPLPKINSYSPFKSFFMAEFKQTRREHPKPLNTQTVTHHSMFSLFEELQLWCRSHEMMSADCHKYWSPSRHSLWPTQR